MAVTQSKRSVHPSKAARRSDRRATSRHSDPALRERTQTRNTFSLPQRKLFHFPQVRNRVVKEVEFSLDPAYKCLELKFKDNTSLSFEFEPSFVWQAYFARWKSGEQRIIRYWPPCKTPHQR